VKVSTRTSTRSQSSLKSKPAYDRPKTSAKKSRTKSEPFIGEQFYKKRSASRTKLPEAKGTEIHKLRERRNKSAELIRRSEGEGSFASFDQSEKEAKVSSNQFFIS
jgi:hypothetical protein